MQNEWVGLARDVFEWVKSGTMPLTVAMAAYICYLCRDSIAQMPNKIFDLIDFRNRSKYPRFSNKDIKRHQIFNTLKFWLNGGIESLSYDNYYIASLVVSGHKDAPD